jgi:hypothetical protein
MEMRVECFAGHRGVQEPRVFWLGARRLTVIEIVDRWLSTERRYFKCATDDGNLYILRYERAADSWDLAAFTHACRQAEFSSQDERLPRTVQAHLPQ